MLKTISTCALLAGFVAAGATPAYAQRTASAVGGALNKQTINFLVGGFFPKGAGSRADGDVLVGNSTFLAHSSEEPFDVGKFKSFTIGGEWLLPVSNVLEVGAGIGFSNKTVPTVYADFLDSDGSEIDSEINLRIIPLAFTLRYLPMGQSSSMQPYVGGGLGVFLWHYSEAGEFIDFGPATPLIFEDTFEESGTSVGPIILGGFRYAAESYSVGGEVRYHWSTGDLDPFVFAGSKIDLGGLTIQGTIGVRF